jgi:hypothetical protein
MLQKAGRMRSEPLGTFIVWHVDFLEDTELTVKLCAIALTSPNGPLLPA